MKLMITILVIMVVGGDGVTSSGTSVELLHSNGTHLCSLPNLPSKRRGHSQTGLTCCGGWDSPAFTSCLTFNSGSWEQSHELAQHRRRHSVWASPQGIMLLGGQDSGTTSEILLESGDTTPGFSLNYRIE